MKSIYKPTVQSVKALFEECLTETEQRELSKRLGETKETVFLQISPEVIQERIVEYLRGA